jgi:hypothetical protein
MGVLEVDALEHPDAFEIALVPFPGAGGRRRCAKGGLELASALQGVLCSLAVPDVRWFGASRDETKSNCDGSADEKTPQQPWLDA